MSGNDKDVALFGSHDSGVDDPGSRGVSSRKSGPWVSRVGWGQ